MRHPGALRRAPVLPIPVVAFGNLAEKSREPSVGRGGGIMPTTTRQENSREQQRTPAHEGTVRNEARRDDGQRYEPLAREGADRERADRERGMQTTREEGRAAQGTRTRGDLGARQDFGFGEGGSTGSPFAMMSRMMDDMDRLFVDFGLGPAFGPALMPAGGLRTRTERQSTNRRGAAERAVARGSWMPAVELFTRGNELVARADLPGLKRDDVTVEIVEDQLVIHGERRNDREERGEGFFHSERSYGSFLRTIPLPEGTDPEGIAASFADGVLEVRVPLPKQEERRKKVEIR
jgi:HSP20 family protein